MQLVGGLRSTAEPMKISSRRFEGSRASVGVVTVGGDVSSVCRGRRGSKARVRQGSANRREGAGDRQSELTRPSGRTIPPFTRIRHDGEMSVEGVLQAPMRGEAIPRRRRRTVWTAVTGVLGAASGVAPHVLHHVGPLVGTALVAGAGGTLLFGVLGLAASVPMLLRLRRRFGSWWAPGVALLIFSAMFIVSSFVVGPLISGAETQPTTVDSPVHDSHHE